MGTSSIYTTLQSLGIREQFLTEIPVPNLQYLGELQSVLREDKTLQTEEEIASCLKVIAEEGGTEKLGIPIKNLLVELEGARVDGQGSVAERAAYAILNLKARFGN